jgi:hypothetical protein
LARLIHGRDPSCDISQILASSDDSEAAINNICFFVGITHLQQSSNLKFVHLLATGISQSNPQITQDFCSILGHVLGYYHSSVAFTVGRKFCVTEGRYLGLVPALTEVGDVIVILGGGRTPFVLRPWFDSLDMRKNFRFEF